MSVWLAIPSKRPPAEALPVLQAWRNQGYRIALWCDDPADAQAKQPDLSIVQPYQGYAHAVNALCREVIEVAPRAGWIVAGGDDTLPDPTREAQEIAAQCVLQFFVRAFDAGVLDATSDATFGVMQPTGDRWGDDAESRAQFGQHRGAFIDRIAGSPWIGREFARRMYGGKGPYHDGYAHMFCDEELQEVATNLGVFWQRRDLTHHHNHFCRVGDSVDWEHGRATMPEFLREANTGEHWAKYSAIFRERKAAGFPGHEPI